MPDAVVITISDSRSAGERADTSGPAAEEFLRDLGLTISDRRVVPDDIPAIQQAVRDGAGRAALIVTTGGTGIGPRDVTPEALTPLFDRELPGFGEIMRTGTYSRTPLSIISRGGAGLIGNTLIVMLPGSLKAVRESLALVGPAIKHVLKIASGKPIDCQEETGAAGR
ncbi:MAG TPA: MogA/MoaB family molybdenum cofactor biosynthesis protein [Phycisphaerae bacterium]|nr:MogA/MoaB family molybdenum cofactor biosynthesis protein [Phycisphaerae bacterium]